MTTITKMDMVEKIADTQQVKKVITKKIVQAFLDEILNELSNGNRLEFRDFGVFETKSRPGREAQNPKTLEKVHVPPKSSVKFKMGRLMKEKLNHQE